MEIINKKNNEMLANKVIISDRFLSRLMGLMFKKKLQKNSSMLIYPCNSVHTFFMKFPIDIVFLSKEYEVLYVIENMLPGKMSPFIRNAKSVLELPSGVIEETKTKKGDLLNLVNL